MDEAVQMLSGLAASIGALKESPSQAMYLIQAYKQEDPLYALCLVMLWMAGLTFVIGTITQEFSWVDRIWSIIPFVYAWLFALHPILVLNESAAPGIWRLLIQAGLATVWGFRLTYNFARKGGYSHMEDYRWAEVRKWFNWLGLQVFNLTFIALYQNMLLFLIVIPSYVSWQHRHKELGWADGAATALFLCFFLMETVADQQQWDFQNAKHAIRSGKGALEKSFRYGDDLTDGFLRKGLFKYSRHPNFFAEFSMWWAFYLFSVSVTGQWLHWSVVGAVLLTALFLGSTWLTEELSLRKYPQYREYQKTTSKLFPWFPGGGARIKDQ